MKDKKFGCCTPEVCEYDKNTTAREVEVCDCPSLSSILESGVVPQSGIEPIYNDMENTDGILGRVRDGFEAVQLSRDIKAFQLKTKKSAPSSAPAPPTSPGSAE